VLSLRRVGWSAGRIPILEDVTFEACRGEFIALTGRNGAGKSTLLDLIAGLRAPASGEIVVGDRSLSCWTPLERARTIGHLPQTVHVQSPTTASQLVMMGRYPHADRWFESDEDRSEVNRSMAECDCLEFHHRRVATLSGGERQRVFLAACLAQRPRLLLLDEPAAFLDIDQQLNCFELLKRQAEAGVLCIAVSHDLNLALEFCTRIIVLAGRTIACDLARRDAIDRTDWLKYFSNRLERVVTADGRARICYR
jgi:ABC-type cobalamin/Fe3+-siderophores transport system ATPase subunit